MLVAAPERAEVVEAWSLPLLVVREWKDCPVELVLLFAAGEQRDALEFVLLPAV